MIERFPTAPKLAEWFVVGFALLAGLGSVVSFWDSQYPFAAYNANFGIRLLNSAALFIDVGLLIACIFWRLKQSKAYYWLALFGILCILGSILAWTELWYGSTFYYGEVRDKQGLPIGVNNMGTFGSFVFLGYIIRRGATLITSHMAAYVGTAVGWVVLWFGQKAILSIVEEAWSLWLS